MYTELLRPPSFARWSPLPERRAEGANPVEDFLLTAGGRVLKLIYPSQAALKRIPAAVNAAARDFETLSDDQLAAVAAELRTTLRTQGLRGAAAHRTFGLIREVARRQIGLRHFDVQLMGGWALLHGMLAEMETGEGKTLTATLPAATAALAGIPVHVVTVNDYLAARDAETMGPIYRALGLTVGVVTGGMPPDDRRAAYACDITYVTNKELVFDYLRDRLALGHAPSRLRHTLGRLWSAGNPVQGLLQRGLHFAIVDEADSVLIDEARTPLIISRRREDEGLGPIFDAALAFARDLGENQDFTLDEGARRVTLTPAGLEHITRLPRTGDPVWDLTARRQGLVEQALAALHFLRRDRQYLVAEDKIQIVDEYTGRVMPDRSWEQGLHQLIEAKENVPLTGINETLARISYQRFFQRYLRLAGMTGTAREVAGEIWRVYRLPVVRLPTNRPSKRRFLGEQIWPSHEEKWSRIVERIRGCRAEGRPVLVGTRSVAASEHLSALLEAAEIPHRVLNARQDKEEAEIIAQAGQPEQVTVATNMAGRGTDICLGADVASRGGLHVIATERHDARRIDRQLFGRCGRQGDPGTAIVIMSLEDDIVVNSNSRLAKFIAGLSRKTNIPGSPLQRRLAVYLAQGAAEGQNRRIRRELMKMDRQVERMLAFSGKGH